MRSRSGSLILFIIFICGSTVISAISCDNAPGFTSSYMRTEGLRLMEFAKETIKEVTLNACAKACTQNEKNVKCESFEYDPRAQECALHPVSGQPFGQSILAKTDPSRAFFQQICLPTSKLCPTPYSFERFPQHALMGHSLEVATVHGGLAECLSLCLDAGPRFGIQCKSAMYYYESNECIMNRETRVTAPSLFAPVVDSTLVDYFENNCFDVSCPSTSSSLHWLRSEEFAIGHDKDVIIESMTETDCKRLCVENGVAGEQFPCRAYVFSSSKEECHLSAESGLQNKKKEGFELSPISTGEYFEKMCLRSPYQCKEGSFEVVPGKQLINATTKILETSNVNSCLEACINEQETCSAATFNYDLDECYLHADSQYTKPNQFTPGKLVDYFDKICDYLPDLLPISAPSSSAPVSPSLIPALSFSESPSTPPPEPFPTLTVETTAMILEEETTVPPPPSLDNSVDDGSTAHKGLIPSIPTAEEEFAETLKPQRDDHKEARGETTLDNSIIEAPGNTKEEQLGVFAANPERVKAHMTTECRLSGISLIVDFEQPTSGALFVQEAFGTCRVLFNDSELATLHIPYPKSDEPNPKCPGEEIRPGFWAFIVVVQRNDLQSPSLMTSNDRVFNVTCDYSSVAEETLFIQTEDETRSDSNVPAENENKGRVRMTILKDEVAISNIGLGEEASTLLHESNTEVELRWTVRKDAKKNEEDVPLGYFINECIAERIGGSPPEPEPLKLIHNGCPEDHVRNRLMRYPVVKTSDGFSTKMKVFRFDGSRKVRIRCTVDVCVEHCPPVLCESTQSDGSTTEVQSFGRKKRQSMAELGQMMKRLRPEFGKRKENKEENKPVKRSRPRNARSITTGTLTIVDRVAVPLNADLVRSVGSEPLSNSLSADSVCLSRPHIFSSIAVAAVLAIGQLLVILNCISRRCKGNSSAASQCSGSTSYTGSSSSYVASSVVSSRDSPAPSSIPSPSTPSKFIQGFNRIGKVHSPDNSHLVHEYETPRGPHPPPHRRKHLQHRTDNLPAMF